MYVTVTVSGPLTPQNEPLELPMVATDVLLLAHVPPEGVLFRVTQAPTHVAPEPVMAVGSAYTVTVASRVQLLLLVLVMVITSAPVEETPVTTPPASTLPVAGALLLHVPPGVLLSVMVRLTQTPNDGVAVITAGNVCTVATAVVRQPVGSV